jgi:hypothetical protein
MSQRIVRLGCDSLPPTPEALNGVDQMIVSSDCLVSDAAGLQAVRGWLHGGGRAWVMLDRVSPDTAARLLGTDVPCTIVDRVGLTEWQFDKGTGSPAGGELPQVMEMPSEFAGTAPKRFEGRLGLFEEPVDMVRTLAPDMNPAYTVNGWPAAFWRRCGRGQVLFTTLAPRGWVNQRPIDKEKIGSTNPADLYAASEPLRMLMAEFLRPYDPPTLLPADFQAYLAGRIGYRIVGRGTVVTILSMFCLGLLVVAAWLSRRGQLAHLGWLGPVTALSAALVLVALGTASRHAVPPTVTEVQLLEVTPYANDTPATGMLTLYQQDESPASLGAARGGTLLPDLKGLAGAAHRMVWTDLDRWHWEHLTLPAGLHSARFEATARLEPAPAASVTFDAKGAVGHVELGPLQRPGDAIIALPSRRNLAVKFSGRDGKFTAGPAEQFSVGQYMASSVFSDEQRRRRTVYQRLLERRNWPRYPMRPMLLTWADRLDLGFTFADEMQHSGSALVTIPLSIERPAPGTRVLIPSPFLTYHSVFVDGGSAVLYDPKHNEWVSARLTPGKALLRFQVPTSLLPLQVDKAAVTIDLQAQTRPLEIFARKGQQLKTLAKRQSPVGRLRIELDARELLQPDEGGGVYLGVAIGEAIKLPGETKAASEWKINELQLELAGRTP